MSLDLDGYKGLAGFRYALRRFLAASETITLGAGVTPRQYQAMLAIKAREEQGMAIKDLADDLMLTHHAAVQLVNRLAKGGFAARSPSADDRRSVLLTLTDKGEALVERLAAQHLQAMLQQEPLLTQSLQKLKRIKA
jgi:DNA-binding MarR family transcriptional regulator